MKRFLAALLSAVLLMTALPLSAAAEGPGDGNMDGGAASVSA